MSLLQLFRSAYRCQGRKPVVQVAAICMLLQLLRGTQTPQRQLARRRT